MLYQQQCEYNYDDKRKSVLLLKTLSASDFLGLTFNRLSHKKTIQSLTNRVAFLESLLARHNIEIPPEGAAESQLSVIDFQYDFVENEFANDEAAGSYTSLTDLGQHSFPSELANATQLTKSAQSLIGMNELGSLRRDPDIIDLFQSSTLPWESVYNFDQPNDGGQYIIQNRRRMPILDFNAVQDESNASAGDSTAPYGRSNLQNPCIQTDNQRTDTLLGSGSILKSIDGMQQSGLATSGQADKSKSVSCASAPKGSAEHDRQNCDDEIMDQLSARMGTFQIAEDGQLRYFGATSNLHILQNGVCAFSPALSRSVRADGEDVLSRAGVGQKVDQDVERHLEDLYFRWEDPAIHVVDEEMYFLAKSAYYSGQDDGPFYSETLKNAMRVET
jgi:hypothetical protein